MISEKLITFQGGLQGYPTSRRAFDPLGWNSPGSGVQLFIVRGIDPPDADTIGKIRFRINGLASCYVAPRRRVRDPSGASVTNPNHRRTTLIPA